MKITFAKICRGLLLVLVLFLIRPAGFILYAYLKDKEAQITVKTGFAQDASRLNETRVDTVVKVLPGIAAATRQISELIKQAKAEGKKISIAGAQHSMGGHTIYPDGIVLDMKTFHDMELDSSKQILRVGAGALWSEVIPYLDRYEKSVSVMQSNNSFSVGGSISVNCHGWQCDAPPISSTVVSFHLMNAEGAVLNCSRTELLGSLRFCDAFQPKERHSGGEGNEGTYQKTDRYRHFAERGLLFTLSLTCLKGTVGSGLSNRQSFLFIKEKVRSGPLVQERILRGLWKVMTLLFIAQSDID